MAFALAKFFTLVTVVAVIAAFLPKTNEGKCMLIAVFSFLMSVLLIGVA